MRHQALRPAALMLSFLLVAAVPARAGTIHFGDAVHLVPQGRAGRAADVRLRVAPQSGNASTAAQQAGQRGDSPASSTQQTGSNTTGVPAGPGGATATTTQTDTTLSQSGAQVETVDLGDVTGTVCDCGEIIPEPVRRAGGFPWWTLLGGIPLICVSGVCFDDDTPPGNPPPTPPPPTPPPPQIPEPATILLFGTGLLAVGARARRRYGRKGLDARTAEAAEEV